MWILKKAEATLYLLPEKTNFTVGRSNVDFPLKDDASISRTHASFSLEKGVLKVTDCGSKYGTYINGGIASNKRLAKDEQVVVQDQDKIRFGLMQNIWTVENFEIASLASALKNEEALDLVEKLQILGGKFVNSMSEECTHLTMSSLTVTLKLLYALINDLPIVRLDYWQAFITSLRNGGQTLPKPENYQPKATDLCKSVQRKEERKTLFNGLCFIFMNRKQYDMYSGIIQKIGGSCKDLNSGVQKSFLTKPKVIVVQYIPSTQSQSSQTISSIADILKEHKKRLVPEYEIGLAIVNCSVEKFCNPQEGIFDDLLPKEKETPKSSDFETLFVGNSASNEDKDPDAFDDDFVVEETDPSSFKNNEKKLSGQSDTLMENNSKSMTVISGKKRSRTKPLASNDADGSGDLEEESSRKKFREETSPEPPSSSRSLRSKALPSARKEVASISKARPKRTLQSITLDSSEDESKKLEPPKKKSLDVSVGKQNQKKVSSVGKTKQNVLSISLDSSEEEESQEKPQKKSKTSEPLATRKGGVNSMAFVESEDESEEKEKQKETPKENQGFNQNAFGNEAEEDEEDLFSFIEPNNNTVSASVSSSRMTRSKTPNKSPVKRPEISSKSPLKTSRKSPQKPSPKPLPLITKTKATRNLNNFLSKSQKAPLASSTQIANESQLPEENEKPEGSSKKRPIIKVIDSEEDEDEENLFNFIDNDDGKKRKRTSNSMRNYCDATNKDDSDDDLFAFNDKKKNDGEDQDEFDLADTQQMAPGVSSLSSAASSSIFQIPKPKVLPAKINVSGWLSCPGIKQEVKEEKMETDSTVVKKETDEDEETSIKGGFEIRFCQLSISSVPNPDETRDNTSNLNTSGKNFKAFVKNRNYVPQTTLIKLKGR